jgi:enoyl-CoA hydratase/carnithine racemase
VSEGQITLERDEALAILTIRRPEKLNSITHAMSRQLFDHLDVINDDDGIRVLIIASEGERAFSAGSDVATLDEYGSLWRMRNRALHRNDYIDALRRCPKPMIAEIDGIAYGGGLEIACIADIRVATPESRFAAAEIKLGWHAGSGQTQYLPRLIGYGNALKMLLTGDPIDAGEAHRMGLVQDVVPREQLRATTLAMARSIASNAPIAVQLTKHIVRQGMTLPLESALAWENDLFTYVMSTEDAAEGQAAFKERRPPRFTGA